MGNTPSSTPSSTPLPPDQPTTEAPTRAPVATHQLARNRRKSDAQFAALGQTTSTTSIDAIDLALDQSGTSSVAPSTDDLFGHGSGGSGGSGPPRLPPGPASSALKPILNTSAGITILFRILKAKTGGAK
ncbi:hypothetical protein HDU79_008284 [Rhizoclosmatium sp. JEL0117]|nr:hypothetical protein HDU79_008284 [Rhizoclosmatium sp. JEL0117]